MEDTSHDTSLEIVILVIFMIPAIVLGTFLALYVMLEITPDYPPRPDMQLERLLQPQLWNPNATHELPYQDYVTPFDSAVRHLSDEVNGKATAYRAAVGWVWVSDATLNGVDEKWLVPHVFLVDTPNYDTNPAKPREASDCEEQANTLVSLLRAEGVEAEDVRVVLGLVNFGGEEGGHAWVEVYENDKWLALEATSGPYYDDDSQRLVERKGMPYNYYETRSYPSLDIWFYYNDVYFIDSVHNEKNAPDHWSTLQVVSNDGSELGGSDAACFFLTLFITIYLSEARISIIGESALRRTRDSVEL
ncbi:MAG: transglutaminase domain-containing protein [Candidatus Bathyarchaeota archaeon]|nr:MAG: transglutaminase domain-containing protein [Candidatus Bathyarchaeota archaeon]